MSKRLVFKPSDFYRHLSDGTVAKDMVVTEWAVESAQRKFDDWLSKQVVVYGSDHQDLWQTFKGQATYRALVINIEPLAPKECEHEPPESYVVSLDPNKPIYSVKLADFRKDMECVKCGAKLVAEWKVAE